MGTVLGVVVAAIINALASKLAPLTLRHPSLAFRHKLHDGVQDVARPEPLAVCCARSGSRHRVSGGRISGVRTRTGTSGAARETHVDSCLLLEQRATATTRLGRRP